MLFSRTLLGLGLLASARATAERPQQPDKLGAIATESSICSNIGIDLLKDGGNAADAV